MEKLERMIREALVEQWGMDQGVRISEIKKTTEGRVVFRVDTDQGSYVLKIYSPTRQEEIVKKDIHFLRFLKEQDFPACNLRNTSNRDGYGLIHQSFAYVYEWIEGKNPEPNDATFEKLGAMTGRLHAISKPYLYASDFRPKDKIKELLATAESKGIDQKYKDLLLNIADLTHLPQGLIHTDIGPHNSLQRPDGEIVIIDWEDAGTGPMIIDIGWELEQCLSDECVFEEDKARALLKGYRTYRALTSGEKRSAYDAALFFALLYWVDAQKEFGRKRIDWLADHREQFERVFEN